jgi:GNAT superfamily N-acetyltransferase
VIAAVQILEATPADALAIAEIHMSARRVAMPDLHRPHTDADTRRWFASIVGDPAGAWWVARGDGVIAGYMLVDGENLDHLYVRPDWQGRGVGTALLNKAKTLSPHRLALVTFQINVKARAFYQARGFHPVGSTDGDNEENEPDVQYAWTPSDNG